MAGYGTDEGFAAWLETYGYTLPGVGVPSVAVLRQRGSAYIDGEYGPNFGGTPTGGLAQERAFPRSGITAYGKTVADDVVPYVIEEASYFAAYQEALQPGVLSPSATNSGVVQRERVEGAVDISYFEHKGDPLKGATRRFAFIEGILAPFLAKSRYGNYGAILVV